MLPKSTFRCYKSIIKLYIVKMVLGNTRYCAIRSKVPGLTRKLGLTSDQCLPLQRTIPKSCNALRSFKHEVDWRAVLMRNKDKCFLKHQREMVRYLFLMGTQGAVKFLLSSPLTQIRADSLLGSPISILRLGFHVSNSGFIDKLFLAIHSRFIPAS